MESVFVERTLPAALGFVFQRVKPLGYVVRGGGTGLGIGGDLGCEHSGDRRLLDDLAVVAAVQPVEDVADRACVLNQLAQVGARALLAGGKAQNRIVESGRDQIVLKRALILEVLLRLCAVDLVERRLRNVDVAALDELFHLPEEKRQQQRADVRAVHVRVGHDDDLVVAQLVRIEFVASDSGAERRDQRADFLARQHLVEARALDVEDLAAQRQNRLEFAVAALLGGAAGAVALDDEQLGLGGIALLTIGQLAGQ